VTEAPIGPADRGPTALRLPARDLVLLADARLHASPQEPNLHDLDVDRRFARNFVQARGEVYFKIVDGIPCKFVSMR
jgi:hypothetical protein